MTDPTDPRAVADDPSGIVQQMPEGGDEALKPCPWCQSKFSLSATQVCAGGGWGILCKSCHVYHDARADSPAAAIAAWDCRATDADLRAEVERLNALADLRAQHAAWSQAQFGDVSAVGPAKHLAKEAMEVAEDPLDPIEHADCWMLLWDMQRRAGISDAQLADAIREKLAINQARRWPAPKEGEAREHDRAALSPETDGGQDD
ncbi:dATP/dGTP pyrophosphohydrolase domain-containing protein [Paracoccus yeei]|uniref:dATP/dGTP pyrophosphohydrolase domain-containing protein n=1 Tax=Paracoccus yeei TaxID=147645 RepID=UPI001CD815CF|nr:dATP/dGTP pyrophosphohydrolase domain-containing protein [Paracoccus yeei]